VLLLDTEGIGSPGSTPEHDARIFSLAVLLSSLLVFNSLGAIDEESLGTLSFVAQLSQLIQAAPDRVAVRQLAHGRSPSPSCQPALS
jgi:hypothetical protein